MQALGDVVLTWEDDRFVVHDAATGGARWTLRDNVELLGGDGPSPFRPHGMGTRLVGHGDATAVLVGCRDEEEQGLALLSGADGRVVWKTPIGPSTPCGPPTTGPRWSPSNAATS